MNPSATLLAQPTQPGNPGLAGLGERGGKRTKGKDATFLRDLRAELARPVRNDRSPNSETPAERARTSVGQSAGIEGVPRGEEPRSAADLASRDARAEYAEGAPGAPTDLHTELQSAGRTDAQADGIASSPTDAVATEGPDAPSDAHTGEHPTDPGSRQSAGQASLADRSRAEQAQAARAIPADRPLTVAELNEALASADVATWPESLRRQLGLDRPAATPAPIPRRPTTGSAAPEATPAWDPDSDVHGDRPAAPWQSGPESASLSQSKDEPPAGDRHGHSIRTTSESAPRSEAASTLNPGAQSANGPRGLAGKAEHIGSGHHAAGFSPIAQGTPREAGTRRDPSAATPPISTGRIFQLERAGAALHARGPSHAHQGSPARHDEAVASQLARGVTAAAEAKGGSVRLHLRPEALGAMTVSVQRGGDASQNGGGVSVAFAVESPETAAMLERSLGDLSAALEERGIVVREASIEVRDARSAHAALAAGAHSDAQPAAMLTEPRPAHEQHPSFDPHQPGHERPGGHTPDGRDHSDTQHRDGAPPGHDAAATDTPDAPRDGLELVPANSDALPRLSLRLDAIA